MSGSVLIFGIFAFMVLVMIFAVWFTKKYKSKLDGGQIIILVFLIIMVAVFFYIKNMSKVATKQIVDTVELKTTVTQITFDPHKPYFKSMTLADGQYIPMPEEMNGKLQIGDSIYKSRTENTYTVVSHLTKTISKYAVKSHSRTLGKPD